MDRGAWWATVHEQGQEGPDGVNLRPLVLNEGTATQLQPTLAMPESSPSLPDLLIFQHVTCQAPLSMEFSRPEYWSGFHFLLQGIFPTQGSNPGLLQADALTSEPPGKPNFSNTFY